MKKLLVIVMAVALVSICSAASAATILSDNDLGELYAADIAVAAQTNNAVIVAVAGDIQNVLSGIRQRNYAKVKREVNELNAPAIAVAAQTNNAALSAGRDINNVEIRQKNKAISKNKVWGNSSGSGTPTAVAVKPQTNNAALSAGRDIKNVDIRQKNKAVVIDDVYVTGFGGSVTAVESQTNLAALSAGRDINNVDIKQKNKAVVVGDVTGLFSTTLAVGAQTNTALLGSTSGSINGVSISQSNRAYVGSGAPL